MPVDLKNEDLSTAGEIVYTLEDFGFLTDPPIIDPWVYYSGGGPFYDSRESIYIPRGLGSGVSIVVTMQFTVINFVGIVAVRPRCLLTGYILTDIHQSDGLTRLMAASETAAGCYFYGNATGSFLADGTYKTAIYVLTTAPDSRGALVRHYRLAIANESRFAAAGTTIRFDAINLFVLGGTG